ncbi:MAG: hypothetical protein ACKVU2_16905 [Saprospiraceae bacterium]
MLFQFVWLYHLNTQVIKTEDKIAQSEKTSIHLALKVEYTRFFEFFDVPFGKRKTFQQFIVRTNTMSKVNVRLGVYGEKNCLVFAF